MNYAWEAVLLAEKSKKDRDSLRFVEAACPSPYIEVSVTDLNAQTVEGDEIEINPLYRFEKLFGRLFDKNITDMPQTRALLFDVCMHYAVQLDLREGLKKIFMKAGLPLIFRGEYMAKLPGNGSGFFGNRNRRLFYTPA